MPQPVHPDLVPSVIESAKRLGVEPSDILTAMSYETGGRLDPNMMGGKGGNYMGLIQFGPEERAKYGVKPDMGVREQVFAAENFLRDRGVKPGMGMLDIYSTINAGRPGLYNRSDAANGGMPGTVADKVATQMFGHRQRANALLGLPTAAGPTSAGNGPAMAGAAPAAPLATATGVPGADSAAIAPTPATTAGASDPLLQSLQMLTSAQPAEQAPSLQMPAIEYGKAPGLSRARALAIAMGKLDASKGMVS